MTPARVAALAAVLTVGLLPTDWLPAAADPGCAVDSDYCAGDEIEIPGAPPGPSPQPVDVPAGSGGAGDGGGGGGGTGGGTSGGGPVCTWIRIPAPPAIGRPGAGARPAPDAVLLWEMCDGAYTGASRWSSPGAPAPDAGPAPAPVLPSPEVIAAAVRVRLEGSLPAPTVTSTPAAGVASFVGFPSFVTVANWTGVVRDGECEPTGLLCVNVTATPSMQFDPGEPDAPAIECAGPGVAFDPSGDPFAQAASPEACAYPYRMRTGVESRPDAWPGVVTVTWDLAWTSSTGAGGSLDPVEKSADVLRPVDEAQTVVVSAGE